MTCTSYSQNLIVNRGETAAYLKTKLTRILQQNGSVTVGIRGSGSKNHRLTACANMDSDTPKISFFVNFNNQFLGSIERNLQRYLPDNVIGCCQCEG